MKAEVIIGKYIVATKPEEAIEIRRKFTPTINKPALVREVYDTIITNHPEATSEEIRKMFLAAAYQLYQPLSFLSPSDPQEGKDKKAVGKLPPGVRDEIAKCLGLNHSEEVNRCKREIEAPMKPESNGVIRPFKEKVMVIVNMFKKYSINPDDYQFNMFV